VLLLSPEEAAVFEQLQAPTSTSNIPSRLNSIFDQLQPTVDSFADSVHKIAQYQKAGDSVASRVLSIAAEKLAEREEESRRRAQPQNAPRSPRTDLGSVLRGLSRADQ
jgi:kinetochore protein Mis13/DSN1